MGGLGEGKRWHGGHKEMNETARKLRQDMEPVLLVLVGDRVAGGAHLSCSTPTTRVCTCPAAAPNDRLSGKWGPCGHYSQHAPPPLASPDAHAADCVLWRRGIICASRRRTISGGLLHSISPSGMRRCGFAFGCSLLRSATGIQDCNVQVGHLRKEKKAWVDERTVSFSGGFLL